MSAYTARVRPHYASTTPQYATDAQISYLERLLTDNELHTGDYDRLWKILEAHRIDMRTPGDGTRMLKSTASDAIDWVKRQVTKAAGPSWQEASLVTHHPFTARQQAEQPAPAPAPAPAAPAAVKFGVYRKDGEVYLVTPSKSHPDRLYAKKLVESAPRLTEGGEVVDFEWEFAPGIVWKLAEADRMSLKDASKLSIKYGKCLKCRKTLKAAKTLQTIEETGVALGPVCRRYFA